MIAYTPDCQKPSAGQHELDKEQQSSVDHPNQLASKADCQTALSGDHSSGAAVQQSLLGSKRAAQNRQIRPQGPAPGSCAFLVHLADVYQQHCDGLLLSALHWPYAQQQ